MRHPTHPLACIRKGLCKPESCTIYASDNFRIPGEHGDLLLFNERRDQGYRRTAGEYWVTKTRFLHKRVPEPCCDEISIGLDGDEGGEYRYRLLDVFGHVVMAGHVRGGEVETLDIGRLGAGVYYFSVEGGKVRGVKVEVKG